MSFTAVIAFLALMMIMVGVVFLSSGSTQSCSTPYYGRVLSVSTLKTGSSNMASKSLTITPQTQQFVITPVTCVKAATIGVHSGCSMYRMDGPPVVLKLPLGTFTPQELVAQVNCLLAASSVDLTYGPPMNASSGKPTTPFPTTTCMHTDTPHTLPGSAAPSSCSCAGPQHMCGSTLPPTTWTCFTPYVHNVSPSIIYRLGGVSSHTCHTQIGMPEPFLAQPPMPGAIMSHIGTTSGSATATPCTTACTASPTCSFAVSAPPLAGNASITLTMATDSYYLPENVACGEAVFNRTGKAIGRVIKAEAQTLTLDEVELSTTVDSGAELFLHRPTVYLATSQQTMLNQFMRNPSNATTTTYISHVCYSDKLAHDKLLVTQGSNDTLALTLNPSSAQPAAKCPPTPPCPTAPCQKTITIPAGSYTPEALMAAVNLQLSGVPMQMGWQPYSAPLLQLSGQATPDWYRTAIPQFVYYPQKTCPGLTSVRVDADATTCLYVLGLAGPTTSTAATQPPWPTLSTTAPRWSAPFLMHNKGDPCPVMPTIANLSRTPAPGTVGQKLYRSTTPPSPPGSVIPICHSQPVSHDTAMGLTAAGAVLLLLLCVLVRKKKKSG